MSKKTVSVFLVCLMILSLAACGKQAKNEPADAAIKLGRTGRHIIPFRSGRIGCDRLL